jgi:16S rRNA (guanine527-N7)-methyltransferase
MLALATIVFAPVDQPTTKARVREVLAPFLGSASLSEKQLVQIFAYLELLLKWNSKMNLTAVRDPEEIATRHFGESFFAAGELFRDRHLVGSAIDLGSGAGFPGLPFKIWAPSLALVLVEASQKKAVFLREAARALGFSDIKIFAQRAETISAQADLVTLRAVPHFDAALRIARGLAKPHGRIALLIGRNQVEIATSSFPELSWQEPKQIPLSRERVLLIGQLH